MSSLLSDTLCSSLDYPGRRPDQLWLVPFTLRVEQLALVVGDVGALLHTHSERLLVSFQNSELKVVFEVFVLFFSFMSVF